MESLREILDGFSQWTIPLMILGIIVWGRFRGVALYEVFVKGAREGFDVAVMVIPYLVAILFVIKVFLASGMVDDLKWVSSRALAKLGMESSVAYMDLLPLALTRPLTGSGARGVMVEIFDRHGPDSLMGTIATMMMGSTETTFYILTVYFGAVQITKLRHTLPACLIADVAGILAAVLLGYWLYAT